MFFLFFLKYFWPSMPSLAFAELNTLDFLYAMRCKLNLCAVYVVYIQSQRSIQERDYMTGLCDHLPIIMA